MRFLVITSLFLSNSLLHAQWALMDDMENDKNWNGPGLIAADPEDATNQVFSVENTGTRVENYFTLPNPIAEGTTATLFFRFRSSDNAGLADWVVGSSDVAVPSPWNDFEGYVRLSEDGSVNNIDIDVRNGDSFSEVGPADTGTWFNVWLVLDNTADTTDVYYNSDPIPATSASTISLTGNGFRNGTVDDLVTILAVNNEPNSTAYLDDIYLDLSGENLTHPFSTDTDNDGMIDDWETIFFGDISRNGTLDFDKDNLTDLEEFNAGTNPTLKDTDGDSLDDDIELSGSANTFDNMPTSANLKDTDGDGFSDDKEIAAASDPNDALNVPNQAAGFQLVENFEGEGMTIGETFAGINGWATTQPTALSITTETTAPNDQIGRIERIEVAGSYPLSKSLEPLGLQVLDNKTGTLFMQVSASSGNLDKSFGLSDSSSPSGFADFEAQAVLFPDHLFRARDADAFRDPANYAAETWMNVWIIADNTSDLVKIYVESPDGQTGKIEITDDGGIDPFNFRNGTTDPLSNIFFMIAANSEAGSTLLVDNIYLDPVSENLATPAPSKGTPASLVITSSSFNENGDLMITFTPGGENYLLTGSSDLTTSFVEEFDAVYDDVNTFTIDADEIIDARRFYRVEKQ